MEAEIEEMAAALEPLLPPPAGMYCCKTVLNKSVILRSCAGLVIVSFAIYLSHCRIESVMSL